jgi:REP element-mobilizing transposase RayT
LIDTVRRRNRRPRLREPGGTYFVTWCLAQGAPPLGAEERTVVADCLRHFDGVRYLLDAWVVMDDHVHVVVTPLESRTLDSVLHSWRSYAAHVLVQRGRAAPIWRRDEHDRIVRADGELAEKVRYVAANPWRRWPEADRYPWVFPQPEP